MKIFISWSGKKSQLVAKKLAEWLELFPIGITTWVSGENIDPGTRWSMELSKALDEIDLGILCLTEKNQLSPWICYEAGALSKKFESSRVIPFLIDFDLGKLKHPLKQFQGIRANEEGTKKLLTSILNISESSNETPSYKLFEIIWSKLESEIIDINDKSIDEEEIVEDSTSEQEKILSLVESISHRLYSLENNRTIDLSQYQKSYLHEEYLKELVGAKNSLENFESISVFIRQSDFYMDSDPEKSLESINQALEINQFYEPALIRKGKALRRLGRYPEAIEALDMALLKNPTAERAIYNRACYKALSGNYTLNEILEDLKQAINLYPNYKNYGLQDLDFNSIKDDAEFIKFFE